MRILLLHPEDSPFDNRWAASGWDLVVDLGWAGRLQYVEWGKKLRCQVRGLQEFAAWRDDVRQIREIFQAGNDYLIDSEGIDWWALWSPTKYQKFYEFLLLQKVAGEISASSELYVTRSHPLADELGALLGTAAIDLSARRTTDVASRLGRYQTALRTLTLQQIVMIAGDKWDVDYRLRRFFTRRKNPGRMNSDSPQSPKMRVLIPSSYRNVTRMAASYAALLPESDFLLVTTRADGVISGLPGNVEVGSLAGYAPRSRNESTEREIAALSSRWRQIEKKFLDAQIPARTYIAALLTDMPHALRIGLRIRDAWRAVLEQEKIDAVLCGDENNPYTRLSVLLAKKRDLRTVHCTHGALDSNILLRGPCSDIYLSKGEMEKNYLVNECDVPADRIVTGAPPHAHALEITEQINEKLTVIVFFSEPYELYSGRTECLYREVLPNLCLIARRHGRRVLLKLHPFESVKARTRLLDRLLSKDDRSLVDVSAEPMSQQILRRAWFAVTVESSTAVECTIAGVPSFLFGWFDLDLYSYGKQYQKFGAARTLGDPVEILGIPDLLDSFANRESGKIQEWDEERERLIYQPITREALNAVLQRP